MAFSHFSFFRRFLFSLAVFSLVFSPPATAGYEYIGDGFSRDEVLYAGYNKVIVFRMGDYNYYVKDVDSGYIEATRMDAAPKVVSNRTFVPVRFLANALGVDNDNINWNAQQQTATLKGKNTLKLKIGNKTMQVTKPDSQPEGLTMDVAPFIENPGRTMLPARYVAEGLGFKVDWDSNHKLVIAYPEGMEKPDINDIIDLINKKNNPAPSTLTPQEIAYVKSEIARYAKHAPNDDYAKFTPNPSVLSDERYNELAEFIKKEYPYVKFDRSLLGTTPGAFGREQEVIYGIDTRDNHVVVLDVHFVSKGQGIVMVAQLTCDLTDWSNYKEGKKYK